MRDGFDGNHDENQELLNALVHGLVIGVAEVQANDLGTSEQLHDDGTGNDGTDTKVHDGPGCAGHDGTESTEQIQSLPGKAKQHDVGHGEVDDQHEGGRPHLLVEANVAFRLRDGGVDVHEPSKSVQSAALVAFPHETGENSRCAVAEENDTDQEEADAFVVTAPSVGTDVPCSNEQEDQPTGQFPVFANEWHLLQRRWEVPLETPHAVGHVGHGEQETEDRCVKRIAASGELVGLPVDEQTVVEHTGQCDGPWNWLVFHVAHTSVSSRL